MVRSRLDERREFSRAFGLQPLPGEALPQQLRNFVAATLKALSSAIPLTGLPFSDFRVGPLSAESSLWNKLDAIPVSARATVNISAETMSALIPPTGSQRRMSWRDLDNS